VVLGWGYFLIAGIIDPLGGIYTLWPLFGIANQVLAAIALCVGTAVIVKMGKARMAWVTIAPLLWLVTVTGSAGWQKLTSTDRKIGFLAQARFQDETLTALLAAAPAADATQAGERAKAVHKATRLRFTYRLNAALCALFLLVILAILLDTLRECWLVLRGRRPLSDATQGTAA
jgi:carbon starvation protein